MHTIWKGAISFGLVHVPIKMFSATENKDISLRYIHKACGSPLKYVRSCPVCEEEVEWEEIAKAYEYEKGRFVQFEKDELDAVMEEASKEIKILDFVDLTDIDPIYFQKTYYLSPGETGSGAYSLLLEALRQTGKIGIAKVSIRTKSSLAAIRVIENCIAMETVFYPDEIRPVSQVPNLPEASKVQEKELEMAKMLVDQLSGPFEPDKYQDEYRSRMQDLIAKKVAGEEITVSPEQKRTNVIDLMEALQASLDAAKSANPEADAADGKTQDKVGKKGRKSPAKSEDAETDDKSAAAGSKRKTKKRAKARKTEETVS